MVVGVLVGWLVEIKVMSLGWMINEKVSQDVSIMRNHGFGLSCGMSLRRDGCPLSLA